MMSPLLNMMTIIKNQDHLTMEERLKVNYDHPHAFDNELLVAH